MGYNREIPNFIRFELSQINYWLCCSGVHPEPAPSHAFFPSKMFLKFSSSFIPLILLAVPHFTSSLSCHKDFLITPSQLSSQNGFYFSENLDFETPTETSLILTAGDKKEGYNYFKIAFVNQLKR